MHVRVCVGERERGYGRAFDCARVRSCAFLARVCVRECVRARGQPRTSSMANDGFSSVTTRGVAPASLTHGRYHGKNGSNMTTSSPCSHRAMHACGHRAMTMKRHAGGGKKVVRQGQKTAEFTLGETLKEMCQSETYREFQTKMR